MPRLASFLALLLTLQVGLRPSVAHGDAPRIAVLELKGTLSRGQLAVLSDKIRSGVLAGLQGKNFVVMSRENMAMLIKDMGLDCESVEGECEVETGRNIGAAYVVSGSVEDVGRGLMLVSLKVHDTTTGALKAAGDVRGTEVIELIDQLPSRVAQVMARAFGEGGQQPVQAYPVQSSGPAQAQMNLEFGAGGGLGVQAKLKEQECARQANQKGSSARATRLAEALSQATRMASQAWRAQASELETCTRLEREERNGCIEAVEQWLGVARSMKVDLPAGVERVQTDCGVRQPAYQAETRMVAGAEVETAEKLLAKLKASDPLSGLGTAGRAFQGIWSDSYKNMIWIDMRGAVPQLIFWTLKNKDSGEFSVSKAALNGNVLEFRTYFHETKWWVNYSCRSSSSQLQCDGVNKNGKFTNKLTRSGASGTLKNGWRYRDGTLYVPDRAGPGRVSENADQDVARLGGSFPNHSSGSTRDLYRCRSSSACHSGSYCVDNNGDGQFFCKPSCRSDSDCGQLRLRFPGMGCHEAYFADGVKSTSRICNERRVNVIDYVGAK